MPLPIGTTGQGTTATFTTAGETVCVRSLTLPTWSMETIDASCLNDEGFTKKIAGDLVDAGSVQLTLVFALEDVPLTPDGVQDTLTILLPKYDDSGTEKQGQLAGTGFISEVTLPSIEIGGLLEQTITFVYDGMTGPLYTIENVAP